MGVVHRATAPDGSAVAIKVLRDPALATPEALARFDREARLQEALSAGGGFVPLLGRGRTPQGLPYLVMPFLTGGALDDRFRHGPLPVAEAVSIVRTVALALGRAHERGVVHRDVKPANVLFDARGTPLLADLGLAKRFAASEASRSASLSQSRALRGTVGYLAPEQVADSKHVGPAADVFALGAILHEALAGRPAFEGATPLDVLVAVAEGRVEPIARLRRDVPPEVAAALARALDPDPGKRFPDGAAFARALAGEAEPAPRSRRPWIAVVAVALVLAVAGTLGVVARGRAERDARAAAVVRALARGESALEGKRLDEARAAADEALARDAGPQARVAALLLRARTRHALHDDPGALGDVDAAFALVPGDPMTLAARGALRSARGEAGAEADFRAAASGLRALAAAGDPKAARELGALLESGRGVAKDEAEAARWFRRAAEGGDVGSMVELGANLTLGRGVAKDPGEAARWFEKAAAAGNLTGMVNLGVLLRDGSGVAKDEAEAARWFRKAAEAGDAAAMNRLALALFQGRGVTKDLAEAARWARKGAEAGLLECQSLYGYLLKEGLGVARNGPEAVRWLRKAAEGGDTRAAFNLGAELAAGRGGERDDVEAVRWFRVAAEGGDPSAMNDLGALLEQGRGAAPDPAEAARWYRKAADLGAANAMTNLGTLHANGNGVARDEAEAFRWFRKAADAGDPVGMFDVATAYEDGRVVAKDLDAAERWYRKAADLGVAEAAQRLRDMGR